MGLDLTLYDRSDNEVASLNWLRNPFGLARWAEDNTGLAKVVDKSLYYVCNEWSYDRGEEIDRVLFKTVVTFYWEKLVRLQQGYFVFTFQEYLQFVAPKYSMMPMERMRFGGDRHEGLEWRDDGSRLALPQDSFNPGLFHLRSCKLPSYKLWFKELVDFAELLQDDNLRFYCSN